MICPFCGYEETKVLDTRDTDENTTVRRRRVCLSCDRRFTTYEKVEHVPVMVVKNGGKRELFSREKILTGILRACDKTEVSVKETEKIAEDIEVEIYNSMTREITSRQIGELVMEKLKDINDIAYVRFASVYRRFQDVSSFIDELEALIRNKPGINE
ncbi:MAG: transcriptional regulator NrdR [Clostridia bacterium]|nr:transcriptional regulator NrdR [Clostridia bacterium]